MGTPARATQAARAKRDAVRRELARHLLSTPAPTDIPADSTIDPKASDSKRPSPEVPQDAPLKEHEAQPTDMKNKLGPGREQLVRYLNRELTPLLAECAEQAEARSPKLSGMYAISIATLAHEDIGAVVDSADPGLRNEVSDPQFFECVRESAFTLIIPTPLTTGQEKFELTGYFRSEPVSPPEPSDRATQ